MDDLTASRTEPIEEALPTFLVGIGASAGGLQSLERFFENVPLDSGMAFVVIQHLSPDFKSMMDELLARHTKLPILRAEEGMPVRANHVYLLPPTKEMVVADQRLHLTDKDRKLGLTLPIDHFLRSLAQDWGPRAAAVILSGTGSDGSRGVVDVHKAGGLVICESEESAKFPGMPLAARGTGVPHFVLPAEHIPAALAQHTQSPLTADALAAIDGRPALDGLDAILDLLRRAYGIDFSYYKPTTVGRRIERRLALQRIDNINDYAARLPDDPDELNALYHDLLIGVTHFFRDSDPFQLLESDVVPQILSCVPEDEDIRVWIAGCATGEEAYSLAILFHEALERAKRPINLKLFATDVHRSSLEFAGQGLYAPRHLQQVSESRLQRYFVKKADGYQVEPELRQLIVFAQHNVIKDAPFTKIDLVSCRNLLIYFQPLAQKRVISLLHFGLKCGGLLLLGSSETPGELTDEFDVVDGRSKCYRKRRDTRLPADVQLAVPIKGQAASPTHAAQRPGTPVAAGSGLAHAYDRMLDKYMPMSWLVDEHHQLVESFGGGEKLLRMQGRRPSRDLLELLDTDARTAIAGALNRVVKYGRPLSFAGIELRVQDDRQVFHLSVEPVHDEGSAERYYLIALQPVEHAIDRDDQELPTEVDAAEMSRDQFRNLEEELRYTKENLQATIEELETSNEEMQATNEELVASNEELQSTNEELHSVNEELYTVNAEYQKKNEELAELNQDMEHLLRSTDVATIFLDTDLVIRKFTPQVADVFDLMEDDVGRRIGTFSHRIRYDRLLEDLAAVLQDGQPRERDVRDLNGRAYFMRMLPYRVREETAGVVLSLIDISVLEEARGQITHLSAIVESSEDAIVGLDMDGKIKSWNASAERLYGYTADEAIGRNISMIVPDEQRAEAEAWFSELRDGDHLDIVEVNRVRRDGDSVHVSISLSPIRDNLGRVVGASSISRDISERKLAEEARAYLSAIVASTDDAIIGKTLDGIVTSWNRGAERLYGYTAEEMIGQSITKLVPADRPNEVPEILAALRRGERLERLHTVRVRKDGVCIDVSLTISPIYDLRGGVIGASAIARDISQLQRALREKQASEQQIRLLLESTAEAIYGLDNAGKCTFVNRACCRLLGYETPDELLGQDMHALIHHTHEDGRPYLPGECAIYQSFMRGQRVHVDGEVFWRKDGTCFFVEAWSHPMVDELGDVRGSVVTFLDITTRKQAVERLHEEARRREHFLAVLSHELRNPLSAIRTATRVLNATDRQESGDDDARRIIDRQASQMTRLLDDLLDVSRITQDKISLNKTVVDLRETVDDAVQSVRALADECQVRIRVKMIDVPLPVHGDVTRLEQIQVNLLSNAIKYSPPGARVVLEITAHDTAAVIRVTDHGAGIAPEMLDSIFDLFVQADDVRRRAHGGMGVGLTLVRKLVDLHDGELRVHSEGLGHGSEFEVRLPMIDVDLAAAAREDQSNRAAATQSRLGIVVVEDQEDNRRMLARLLELEDMRVHTAANGPEALQLFRNVPVEVAIIDIGLPEMDGYEVARQLRGFPGGEQLTLIALTGYGQPQDVERAIAAGFDHHLIKPLQPDRLMAILRTQENATQRRTVQ